MIWKIDKFDYLTGEVILTSGRRGVIKQASFNYSSLEKVSEKQTKTIADQGKKQINAIEKTTEIEKQKTTGWI